MAMEKYKPGEVWLLDDGSTGIIIDVDTSEYPYRHYGLMYYDGSKWVVTNDFRSERLIRTLSDRKPNIGTQKKD